MEDIIYESPSAEILDIQSEGLLCISGTESLGENEGYWNSES